MRRLVNGLIARAKRRPPDFVVGGYERPYLRRWWLIPRNPVFNVYLHQFLRDDDDRALHDHPWMWCSVVLRGRYIEHTIEAGGIHRQREFSAGAVRVHLPSFAHRLALPDSAGCWTLFITGPRVREWGFHCHNRWVRWQSFTSPLNRGQIGRGCG